MPARRNMPFEEHESDEFDDIGSDTTVDSNLNEDGIYDVEKILLERYNEDQERREYFIKWQSFPIAGCTWEPAEQFDESYFTILDAWRATQRRIQQGLEQPFDMEDYYDAVEELSLERELKQKLRRKKRQRQGKPVYASVSKAEEEDAVMEDQDAVVQDGINDLASPQASPRAAVITTNKLSDDERSNNLNDPAGNSDSDDVLSRPTGPRQTRSVSAKAAKSSKAQHTRPRTPSKRKGVAQVVKTKSVIDSPCVEGGEAESHIADPLLDELSYEAAAVLKSSDLDSLFGESSQKTSENPKGSDPSHIIEPQPRQSTTEALESMPAQDHDHQTSLDGNVASAGLEKGAVSPSTATTAVLNRPLAPKGSSVATTIPLKTVSPVKRRTPIDSFANWSTAKQPRKKSRTQSGGNLDGLKNPRHRHNVQFKAAGEAAPDLDALPTVDPKTGRVASAKLAIEKLNVAEPAPHPPPMNVQEQYVSGLLPISVPVASSMPEGTESIPANFPMRESWPHLTTQDTEVLRTRGPEHTADTISMPGPDPMHALRSDTENQTRQNPSSAERNSVKSRRAPTPNPVPSISSALHPVEKPASVASTDRSETEQLTSTSDNSVRPTCKFWAAGHCRLTAEACSHAHSLEVATCFFWHRGHCSKSAARCPWAHRETGRVAPPPRSWRKDGVEASASPMQQQDSVSKSSHAPLQPVIKRAKRFPTTTCWHWKYANCWNTSETCDYAHHETSVLGPSRESAADKKGKTCYYWATGGCIKSEEQCEYAHRDTGILVDAPGVRDMRARLCSSLFTEGLQSTVDTDGNSTPSSNKTTPGSAAPPSVHVDFGGTSPRPCTSFGAQGSSESSKVQSKVYKALHDDAKEPSSAPVKLMSTLKTAEQAYSVCLVFPGTTTAQKSSLVPEVLDCELQLQDIALAADVERYLLNSTSLAETSTVGDVVPSPSESSELAAITEICRTRCAGLIARTTSRTFILFPRNAEEWSFAEKKVWQGDPGAPLRFCLLPDLLHSEENSHKAFEADHPQQSHLGTSRDKTRNLGKLIGLDVERLLTIKENKALAKYVFLMFPRHRADEHRIVSTLLRNSGCKVYTAWRVGAWQYFRRNHYKEDAVVIVHDEFALWRIPGLQNILVGSSTRIFRIIADEAGVATAAGARIFYCERIFPHGEAILITDDTIIRTPDRAAAIIDQVIKEIKNRPAGMKRIKVVTRPGIKDMLTNLMLSSASQQGTADPKLAKLYQSICNLCPPDAEDNWHSPSPLPSSVLVSVPADHMPNYTSMWKTDRRKATDYLVNWFAGWAVSQAGMYRRFTVCFEPEPSEYQMVVNEHGAMVPLPRADPRGWTQAYQHINIQTADEFLKSKTRK